MWSSSGNRTVLRWKSPRQKEFYAIISQATYSNWIKLYRELQSSGKTTVHRGLSRSPNRYRQIIVRNKTLNHKTKRIQMSGWLCNDKFPWWRKTKSKNERENLFSIIFFQAICALVDVATSDNCFPCKSLGRPHPVFETSAMRPNNRMWMD